MVNPRIKFEDFGITHSKDKKENLQFTHRVFLVITITQHRRLSHRLIQRMLHQTSLFTVLYVPNLFQHISVSY